MSITPRDTISLEELELENQPLDEFEEQQDLASGLNSEQELKFDDILLREYQPEFGEEVDDSTSEPDGEGSG